MPSEDKLKKESRGIKFIFEWLLDMAVFFVVFFVVVGGLELYNYAYKGKVYPRTSVGEIDLGGKTKEQALALLLARADEMAEVGQAVRFGDKEVAIRPLVYGGENGGAAYELWSYDLEESVAEAYGRGRDDNFLLNTLEKISALWKRRPVLAKYQFNEKQVKDILKEEFGDKEQPGSNARIVFKGDKPEIETEKFGQAFDYDLVMASWRDNLGALRTEPIDLVLRDDQPEILKGEAETALGGVEEILALAPITLSKQRAKEEKIKKEERLIRKEELKDWLEIKKEESGRVYLGLNEGVAREKLTAWAEEIDQPAKEARFQVENGRVKEFQSSEDGEVIDIEQTLGLIENKIFKEKNNQIEVIVKTDKAKISNESVNDLGIKELVASGASDFSGSPVNRRHNIATGAVALNGILIKPEEQFSLLRALGEINGENGYKPELVIKEGKTIPEFGGGLCQIGTTVFRLAINAGLPIVERRNHSYRVTYYEPAGTDATIYDPWPDLKFINDTGNYLLLQTKVEGNKLFFDFWGTRDGRSVATTTPVIYNIVKPGPTKMIESEDLKPGDKKCIEKPHNGADAYFKRTITWPEGIGKENSEETFRSHYVPWSEVCLVGKAGTSTAEIIEAQ